ncbi:thymidine kinase [Caldicellulosiruptor acetigenus]|mgnify:CR=1 FL=1|uniref:thymidine kinase n=1 Tax=Caldicellulosiruptor acetigenus TaxID=301953 RepID=UPI0022A9DBD7|nr:thymidine kinase [Caldicellulosiruptor acetigenus]WAM36562.1 thymidine kinase [Caldicellulosiruptor acetigenus]
MINNYVGKLIVYTGSMFSGKTTQLLETLRRFQIAGYSTMLFKPSIDTRYSISEVVNHPKNYRFSAVSIEYIEDIERYAESVQVIGIDEFQFIKSIFGPLKTIDKLLLRDKTIIIAGLDIDFKGRPFESMKEVLPVADYVYKLHAICVKCGQDAWISHRTTDEGERIVIGAEEKYQPLCRRCFYRVTQGK